MLILEKRSEISRWDERTATQLGKHQCVLKKEGLCLGHPHGVELGQWEEAAPVSPQPTASRAPEPLGVV